MCTISMKKELEFLENPSSTRFPEPNLTKPLFWNFLELISCYWQSLDIIQADLCLYYLENDLDFWQNFDFQEK